MSDAGLSFASSPDSMAARDAVPEVMAAYERAYSIPVVRPARVTDVTRADRHFVVRTGPGSPLPVVEVRCVVNATGTWTAPRHPSVPGADTFMGLQVLTPQYPGAGAFAGMRVAVMGGGLSALGFMDELAGVVREMRWYTRRPPQIFDDASVELGLERGRAAVAAQDAAALAGKPLPSIVAVTGIPLTPPVRRLRAQDLLHARPMPVRITANDVIEGDGTRWSPDAIIWALGFRHALDHLAPLGIVGPDEGVRVDQGRVAGQPGLLLAGYAGQASTISAARGARVIARHVRAFLDGSSDWPE